MPCSETWSKVMPSSLRSSTGPMPNEPQFGIVYTQGSESLFPWKMVMLRKPVQSGSSCASGPSTPTTSGER